MTVLGSQEGEIPIMKLAKLPSSIWLVQVHPSTPAILPGALGAAHLLPTKHSLA